MRYFLFTHLLASGCLFTHLLASGCLFTHLLASGCLFTHLLASCGLKTETLPTRTDSTMWACLITHHSHMTRPSSQTHHCLYHHY